MTETRKPLHAEDMPIVMDSILDAIDRSIGTIDDPIERLEAVQRVRALLHEVSPLKHHPVDGSRWVPVHKVHANDYNPNAVAKREMGLLYTSISHDGYTQDVVTFFEEATDTYQIVDGFHRYLTLSQNGDLMASTMGMLPVVVIDKPIEERMASTVRHNRARGKHSIDGMANTVFSMLNSGMTEAEVCRDLGLSADEIARYKYTTGFAKLFDNIEYKRKWETRRQIRLRRAYLAEHPEEADIGDAV